jgi:putative ABC transport system permease protein
LLRTDLGVTTDHVVTTLLDLSLGRTLGDVQQSMTVEQIIERVSGLPGVVSAGGASAQPPGLHFMRTAFRLPNERDGRTINHLVGLIPATPGYFSTLGVRLLRGRDFQSSDGPAAPPVAILAESAARQFFGSRDPIGLTLPIGPSDERGTRRDATVIGVVTDVKYVGIDMPAEGIIYRPYAQQPWRIVFLAARTTRPASAMVTELRRAVLEVDAAISVLSVRTMDDVVAETIAQPRFRTIALGSLAALALALAAIGLYGGLAYSVSRRTFEIGIRIALGASPSNVRGLVVGESLRLTSVGVIVGLAGAWATSRFLEGLLFGLTAADWMSYAMPAGALLLIALAASYLPARRAMRVDPVVALRAE